MSTVNPDSVAQDQLQSFVRRIEAIEDEITALNGDKSEVYKDAKGNGFDTKVLRKVIADRRKDATERNEFDAVYQLYWDAIHGVVRAHVENIEEFDPETGEVLNETPVSHASVQPGREEPGTLDGAASAGETVQRIPELPGAHPTDPLRSGAATRKDADTAAPETLPIATSVLPPTAGANDDRGGADSSPVSASVVSLHRHNPKTHFLNSKGLPRLHGCQRPECCASESASRKLCFTCSLAHDGPAYSDGAA